MRPPHAIKAIASSSVLCRPSPLPDDSQQQSRGRCSQLASLSAAGGLTKYHSVSLAVEGQTLTATVDGAAVATVANSDAAIPPGAGPNNTDYLPTRWP